MWSHDDIFSSFFLWSCNIMYTSYRHKYIFSVFFSSASSMWLLRCGLVPVPSPTLSQSHIVSENWRGLPWQDALLLEFPLFLDCRGELLKWSIVQRRIFLELNSNQSRSRTIKLLVNQCKYLLINFIPRGLGSARAASLPPDGLLCNYTTHLCHGQRLQGYEFCIRWTQHGQAGPLDHDSGF